MDSHELLLGRPYGGCGILYRKSLSPYISRLKSDAKRFCAVSLASDCTHGGSYHTLIVNMYLPTDYGTHDSNNAFLESLAELDGFISAQSFDNILCGDFNVDFSRDSHNCKHLLNFMTHLNLVRADTSSNIRFTYKRDDYSASSWPDHILTLRNNTSHIVGVACLDNVDNFSDHLPLVFNLVLQVPLAMLTSSRDAGSHFCPNTADRIDWHMVTSHQIHNFCCYLDTNLPSIPDDLVSCCNPHCNSHYQLLDSLCSQLLECLLTASSICLPKVKKRRHLLAGWNASARSLKQSAAFWHKLWCDSGCPTSGVLFQIKKHSKKRFKYEVRRLKRQQEHIRREQLGDALSQSRYNDFWRVVCNAAKSSKGASTTSPCVDHCSCNADIANAFGDKLLELGLLFSLSSH